MSSNSARMGAESVSTPEAILSTLIREAGRIFSCVLWLHCRASWLWLVGPGPKSGVIDSTCKVGSMLFWKLKSKVLTRLKE